MKKLFLVALSAIAVLTLAGLSFAEDAMKMDMKKDMKMDMPATEKIEVDGYTVEHNLMTMTKHHNMMQNMKMDVSKMKMDVKASHHLSLKISDTKTGKSISNAIVKVKAINPDKSSQEQMAMANEMMNDYGCDLSMKEKGKYGIIVLFKTTDGSLHTIKYWEEVR